jgi:hypothetical protein
MATFSMKFSCGTQFPAMKTQMLCDSPRGNHTVHLEKTCFSGPAVTGAVLNSLIYRKNRASAELPFRGDFLLPINRRRGRASATSLATWIGLQLEVTG